LAATQEQADIDRSGLLYTDAAYLVADWRRSHETSHQTWVWWDVCLVWRRTVRILVVTTVHITHYCA
jgi:hypothetical protein